MYVIKKHALLKQNKHQRKQSKNNSKTNKASNGDANKSLHNVNPPKKYNYYFIYTKLIENLRFYSSINTN